MKLLAHRHDGVYLFSNPFVGTLDGRLLGNIGESPNVSWSGYAKLGACVGGALCAFAFVGFLLVSPALFVASLVF